ncbi:MAG: SDR family NAD(P)-dependent oxidoreductase [Dehalococcoidia bacterium]
MDIAGKVALVTGAGSGIGRSVAVNLAKRGANVLLVDLQEEGLQETEKTIKDTGGKCSYVTADVTLDEELERAFAMAKEAGPLQIVVNNAGVTTGRPRFPDKASRWRRTVDVDLGAVIAGNQLAILAMRDHGQGGAIVNTASMAGLEPFPADVVYSAAKGGVVFLTRSLAPLAEEGIRVNCVCPGMVDTAMVRQGREESADDPIDPEMRQIIESLPLIPPQQVADAMMELIENDEHAGRAMRVAIKGNKLVEFPHLAPMAVGGRSVVE